VPAAAKVLGHFGYIDLVADRTRHQPDAFGGAHQQEQRVGVEQVAQFVGDGRDFVGSVPRRGAGDQHILPVDLVPLGGGKQWSYTWRWSSDSGGLR
jgi:hypothetical protein